MLQAPASSWKPSSRRRWASFTGTTEWMGPVLITSSSPAKMRHHCIHLSLVYVGFQSVLNEGPVFY